jgi:hypothetical protein
MSPQIVATKPAMLAAQMAAVHNATMIFARRLAHVENIPQQTARSGPEARSSFF